MKGGKHQMENSAQVTLNDFFYSGKENAQGFLNRIDQGPKFISLKEEAVKESRVQWPVLSVKLEESIADLLNTGIPDIFLRAWNKYKILLKYLDREKYPPDQTFLVTLSEHTIQSEHHPYLEIYINEKSIAKIEFSIALSLKLNGIILKIRNGKIMEILTGTCKAKGSVTCEDIPVMEKESETFALPGSIKLGDGVPIACERAINP